MASHDTLLKILDLARWAPSGDNTQPWRFEIVGNNHIAVYGYDTREWCVYDYQGRASYMAHGALLETVRIAATNFGMCATWTYRSGTPDTAPVYDVYLVDSPMTIPDPLISFIERRTVQRRLMRMKPLTIQQRMALQTALHSGYSIQLFESFADRIRLARLLWDNAHIRLTCPEAYEVHKVVIEWGARFSQDRIPEQAIGVDPVTARLMRWVMQRWERLDFFNRYLFGTIMPRIQLDALPAIFCAAHLLIRAEKHPQTLIDFVHAGSVMQRVWLTCAANGLFLQPEMTPLIFKWYADQKSNISHLDSVNQAVLKLSDRVDICMNSKQDYPFFLCRIGSSIQPSSRSTRKVLRDLMLVRQ